MRANWIKLGLLPLMLLAACATPGGGAKKSETAARRPGDPDPAIDARVDALAAQMTLDEKIGQLVDGAPAIQRLDIPQYNWWNEGLHGVARAGEATVFPQAIGMAATWNPELIHSVADVISTEARAKYNKAIAEDNHKRYYGLTYWSPNINIFRDPRWGRGQETYGEDPFLTASIGKEFVEGLQGDDPKYFKVVATAKHFAVHSGPESSRHEFDAQVNDRFLREIYLPAFKALVMDAHVYSVMGAYNRLRGEPACASDFLLNKTLRGDWGFAGYVVSDCGAIDDFYKTHKVVATAAEAAALGVKMGCDLNCGKTYAALKEAVAQGLLTEKDIDVALKRLLQARFRLGMFDPPADVPYSKIAYSENVTRKSRELSRQTARESMVLLKNEKNILPLPKSIKTIAVIGPNAASTRVLEGNYQGRPVRPVSALEGIRAALPEANVIFAPGCGLTEAAAPQTIPASALRADGRPGLKRETFDNAELTGSPVETTQADVVDLEWEGDSPCACGLIRNMSMRWSGEIIPPQSGNFQFVVTGDDGFRLFVNDKPVIDAWTAKMKSKTSPRVALKSGEPVSVRLEYYQASGGATIRLQWIEPGANPREEAVGAALRAEAVVIVAGLSATLEGEEGSGTTKAEGFTGGDRTNLKLPKVQEDLIRAVAATGTPVVLVLMNGSALAVNWEQSHLPAIVEAWYPGDDGGNALADLLFGDYNPAGRLPVTFYESENDLPPFDSYDMTGRTYQYFKGKALYPFGHGLSYTSFEYKDVEMKAGDSAGGFPLTVTATIKNSGARAGEEVAQLYFSCASLPSPAPIRRLIGFKREAFKAGQTRKIEFTVTRESLEWFDEGKQAFAFQPGDYTFEVGASSADIRMKTLATLR